MSEDRELAAMQAIMDALAPLESNVALRVVRWAYERSKEKLPASGTPQRPSSPPPPLEPSSPSEGGEVDKQQYPDLPAFYHAIDPSTDPERALVVGYWFQMAEKSDGFYSYSINSRLKKIGFQIGNITRAFEALMEEKPGLVFQVSRGDTPQARKKLRLTTEGIRKVESMLQRDGRT